MEIPEDILNEAKNLLGNYYDQGNSKICKWTRDYVISYV